MHNVLSKTVKLRVYAFQDTLAMLDHFVKNHVLYHVRKILVESIVSASTHQTDQNANVKLVALEILFAAVLVMISKTMHVLHIDVEQMQCVKWIELEHRVFAHHFTLTAILT